MAWLGETSQTMENIWNIDQANDFLDSGIGHSLPATPEKKLQLQEAINEISTAKVDPTYMAYSLLGNRNFFPLLIGGLASTAIVGTANMAYKTFFITENVTDEEDKMHQDAGGYGDLLATKYNRMLSKIMPLYESGAIREWTIKEESSPTTKRDHLHAIIRTNLPWEFIVNLPDYIEANPDDREHWHVKEAYLAYLKGEWEYYLDEEGLVVFRRPRRGRRRRHTEGFPFDLDGQPYDENALNSDTDYDGIQDLIDAGDDINYELNAQAAAAIQEARLQLRALRIGVNSVKALIAISAIISGLMHYLDVLHDMTPKFVASMIRKTDKEKYKELYDALEMWESEIKQDQEHDFFESEDEEIDIITVDENPHVWEAPYLPDFEHSVYCRRMGTEKDKDSVNFKSECWCEQQKYHNHRTRRYEGPNTSADNGCEYSTDEDDSDYVPSD
jgi:hypothetical protein